MSSFKAAVLDNLRLTHDVVTAIRGIAEGKGRQDLFKERAPDVLENLRQVAIIESTKSSNRLEGVILPRTAIEVLVRRNEEPKHDNRSEGEIAGYRNVLQLIHDRHDYMPLTPESGASAPSRSVSVRRRFRCRELEAYRQYDYRDAVGRLPVRTLCADASMAHTGCDGGAASIICRGR